MKVLAIPATNTRDGLNRKLIGAAVKVVEDQIPACEIEIIDINDYEMPIYSVERQAAGMPALAQDLFTKFGEADAIVLSFAEHNGSYAAAWKNIYDWMSRIDMSVYQGAKVVMFSATPGPLAGGGVLGSATLAAPFFGAELVGSLGVGNFAQVYDPDTESIVDPDLRDQFTQLLAGLAEPS
ncbi:MAG: NAD(P)H-dependent oxidoreductase [Actinomycetota bacterium]